MPTNESTAPQLLLRLLGTFTVEIDRDGRRQRLGTLGGKSQPTRLIKTLASQPNHSLDKDVLTAILLADGRDRSPGYDRESMIRQTVLQANLHLCPDCTSAKDEGYYRWVQSLDNGLVTFDPAEVWSDLAAFRALCALPPHERTLAEYRDALALYRGDLLEVDRDVARLEWAKRVREECREALVRLLQELIDFARSEPHVPEVRALVAQARAQLDDLGRRRAAQRDQPLASEREVGGRLDDLLAAPPHNLRRPPTPLIGRATERRRLRDMLLGEAHLVTLTGEPGIGKTRLAAEVGHDLLADFPDGLFFVDLADLRDHALVPMRIAETRGLRVPPRGSVEQRLIDHYRDRREMLILDNAEQISEVAAILDELIAACPDLRIMVTSRASLRLRAEHLLRLDPLPFPPADEPAPPLAVLSGFDAVIFFIDRATMLAPGFALTEAHREAVAAICGRLEGLPLALELAASRLDIHSPQEIRDGIIDRLDEPTLEMQNIPVRQQSLRAALDWSYDLLTPSQQALYRQLGILTSGGDMAAIGAIAADGPPGPGGIAAELRALVGASLVRRADRAAATRFRMLEPIREDAMRRLAAAGEAPAISDRHAAYFLGLAEEAAAATDWAERVTWRSRLLADYDNMVAALDNFLAQESPDGAQALAAALAPLWRTRGRWSEGAAYLARALREETIPSSRESAACLRELGILREVRGDLDEARAAFEACLHYYRAVGDSRGIAVSRDRLGVNAYFRKEYDTATAHHLASLAFYRQIAERAGVAATLINLGNVAERQSDLPLADKRHQEALAIYRDMADDAGVAMGLNNLANIASSRGDLTAARGYLDESVARYRSLNDPFGTAIALGNLGNVVAELGESEAARGCYEESLRLRRDLGDRLGVATCIFGLGSLDHRQGRLAAARRRYEESLTTFRALGAGNEMAECLGNFGLLAEDEGDPTNAAAHQAESLRLRMASRERIGIAASLDAFASLAAATGKSSRAIELWAHAELLLDQVGAKRPTESQAKFKYAAARIRRRVGNTTWDSCWASGRARSTASTVNLALEPISGPMAPSTSVDTVDLDLHDGTEIPPMG